MLYWTALCITVMLAVTSCDKKGESIGTEAQLFGRWQDTKTPTSYIVFTSEKVSASDPNFGEYADYYWGKEWDSNEKTEEQLNNLDYHGNGWFMWKKGLIVISRLETHNLSPAVTPADMNLVTLTDNTLQYKTDSGREYSFSKIATE